MTYYKTPGWALDADFQDEVVMEKGTNVENVRERSHYGEARPDRPVQDGQPRSILKKTSEHQRAPGDGGYNSTPVYRTATGKPVQQTVNPLDRSNRQKDFASEQRVREEQKRISFFLEQDRQPPRNIWVWIYCSQIAVALVSAVIVLSVCYIVNPSMTQTPVKDDGVVTMEQSFGKVAALSGITFAIVFLIPELWKICRVMYNHVVQKPNSY